MTKLFRFREESIFIIGCMIIAFFVHWGAVFAGITGKIAGTIKDAETNQQLAGVNVIIEDTRFGAATDISGYYFIVNLPPGIYSVRASMIGYEEVVKTNLRVSTDHTTALDFSLKSTVIEGAEVVVVAEREVIKQDVSSSQIVADVDQVVAVPMIRDVTEYIHLQAGIEDDLIRGGGLDQTGFMVDGLVVVDNRTNRPLMSVNLSTIQEVSIIKGGFNAEYGNIRSGLINIVTKDPSFGKYHGSIDVRMTPAHLKHSGASIYSPDNFYLRSYLDPGVCWVGTRNGTWDEAKQKSNIEFEGWNSYSAKLLADDDPTNDRTPEECRDLFLWNHAAEGSGKLGQKEGKYGHKPDWNLDISFAGGVPLIGEKLGNLSFFASYRTNWEMFAFPTSREYYKEDNSSLKFLSHINPSMKLAIEGSYGTINSVAMTRHGGFDNDYAEDGDDIMESDAFFGPNEAYNCWFWPSALVPFNIYRSMIGVSFDHIISPTTFYNVRISNVYVKNHAGAYGSEAYRDTSTIRYFGSTPVDETPYGYWIGDGTPIPMQDGAKYNAIGGGARDFGEVSTINVKFDLTSQIDAYNQIKTGVEFVYDDIRTHFERVRYESMWENWVTKWDQYPYRIGAYIQDKLEFEGMIANVGLRLDYNAPNSDWYSVDPYSVYLSQRYKHLLESEAPKEKSKGYLKISPRLGISHPISENVKLYFSYGHFYSMPSSSDMYEINWGRNADGITRLGNPSLRLPETIAYELGVEYNIANMVLLHLAGFYKDVSDQINDEIGYTNYSQSVDYVTYNNNNYEDIRGFEVRIEKTFGQWITGFLNYHYQVRTSGFFGRNHYYEDPRLQAVEGLQDPNIDRTDIRPNLRANVRIQSPVDWGPTIANIKPLSDIAISPLVFWRAGRYETWNPLEIEGVQNDIHWKPSFHVDMRISKQFTIGRTSFELFADIYNVFNNKYIDDKGFYDDEDREYYFKSLRLPMYEDPKYDVLRAQEEGYYIAGNDKVGDRKSEDKPYINMPNREFLTYRNLRSVEFGLRINF